MSKAWFVTSGLVRLLITTVTLVGGLLATSRWSLTAVGLTGLTATGLYALSARYDEWKTPLGIAAAKLRQSHSADWEVITIGYSMNRVLFAGYCAQCGGTWRYFQDVIVANLAGGRKWDPLGARLHATAAYADGSHAMYFEPESGRQPDSFSCEFDPFSGMSAAAAYAANVRDRSGADVEVILTPVHHRRQVGCSSFRRTGRRPRRLRSTRPS